MMVVRRTRGFGVRKPPKEETAGGVTKLRVRRYGDLDAGGLLPGCVGRAFESDEVELSKRIKEILDSKANDTFTRSLKGER
jgi:hypothetical protein